MRKSGVQSTVFFRGLAGIGGPRPTRTFEVDKVLARHGRFFCFHQGCWLACGVFVAVGAGGEAGRGGAGPGTCVPDGGAIATLLF